jgi:Ca-activated chloride channel family protein
MAISRGASLLFVVSVLAFNAREPAAQSRPPARILKDVELVQIPVIVFDDKGTVATNLSRDDFRVLDDGVEQQLLYCERERESVSFVILADVSSSMTKKIPFVQEAALSVLDPNPLQDQYRDEYSVFGIETHPKRLLPFTRDQQDLERRLPLLLTPTNGSTALFDGIYMGVAAAQREAGNRRRAMIIISDGGDNHSRYNLHETRSLLEESDVPVFAVMAGSSFELSNIFAAPDNRSKRPSGADKRSAPPFSGFPVSGSTDDYIGPAERRGPHNLKSLTEVTGGGVFTANNIEDLPRIVHTIGLAVRYRYVLTYKPVSDAIAVRENAFRWHKIRIELRPKERFAGYGIPYYKRGYNKIN